MTVKRRVHRRLRGRAKPDAVVRVGILSDILLGEYHRVLDGEPSCVNEVLGQLVFQVAKARTQINRALKQKRKTTLL